MIDLPSGLTRHPTICSVPSTIGTDAPPSMVWLNTPECPSRTDKKTATLLSADHPEGSLQFSLKVRRRELDRCIASPSRSPTCTLVWPSHCKKAIRFPSDCTVPEATQAPAQFVTRVGFSMGFPLRGSGRNAQ